MLPVRRIDGIQKQSITLPLFQKFKLQFWHVNFIVLSWETIETLEIKRAKVVINEFTAFLNPFMISLAKPDQLLQSKWIRFSELVSFLCSITRPITTPL